MSEDVIAGSVVVAQWKKCFSGLRDSRQRRGKRHGLSDVVLIALLGMLSGCNDADELADWADARKETLQTWFGFEHGTPSQDTFLRVFGLINPKSFDRAVTRWLKKFVTRISRGQIAIDGKSLRGSLKRGGDKSAVHIVSAWLNESGMSLGQIKTSDKSNEIKAIPELLKLLDITGCLVSIDAAGCHKEIARKIVDGGGHYLLALKDNQPTLRRDCEDTFKMGLSRRYRVAELERPEIQQTRHVDGGHGRIEERTAMVCRDLHHLTTCAEWPGIAGVGRVDSHTTDKRTGRVSTESRFYIFSDPAMGAEEFLTGTREHWSVESMHWVLDVVFGEDASRIENRRAAENFSALRRTVLSLIKATPPPKKGMSLRRRRRWCNFRMDYLLQVVQADPTPQANAA